MLQRRLADPLGQGLDADKVGQKGMGQVGRHNQEDGVFCQRARR